MGSVEMLEQDLDRLSIQSTSRTTALLYILEEQQEDIRPGMSALLPELQVIEVCRFVFQLL
jgi:hypothetical protein